jgi:NAD(P)-dependent dehydrogenase (short-subunit alcohol dehydrogenase family)
MNHLITGANRGIGLELAKAIIARGDTVIGTVRHGSDASELAACGAKVIELDVADQASVDALGSALSNHAPVDVLINNAGVSSELRTLESCTASEFARIFAINAAGPVMVARAALASLERGSRRLIVNISSQLGSIRNNAGGSSYGYRASKAALNMLTVTMANELRPRGFTCVTMHPGWVRTRMGGDQAPLLPPQAAAMILAQIDSFTPADSGSFRNYDGSTLPW